MIAPDYFKRATDGFYQGALEYGGHTVDDCVRMGVGMVRQSQCGLLLSWLDDLIGSDDDVVVAEWAATDCEYGWDDAEFIRGILRRMRDRVAERVATGGGGMPG